MAEIVKLPVEVEGFNNLLDQGVACAKRIVVQTFGLLVQEVTNELRELDQNIRRA